jgi:hypothetical protein
MAKDDQQEEQESQTAESESDKKLSKKEQKEEIRKQKAAELVAKQTRSFTTRDDLWDIYDLKRIPKEISDDESAKLYQEDYNNQNERFWWIVGNPVTEWHAYQFPDYKLRAKAIRYSLEVLIFVILGLIVCGIYFYVWNERVQAWSQFFDQLSTGILANPNCVGSCQTFNWNSLWTSGVNSQVIYDIVWFFIVYPGINFVFVGIFIFLLFKFSKGANKWNLRPRFIILALFLTIFGVFEPIFGAYEEGVIFATESTKFWQPLGITFAPPTYSDLTILIITLATYWLPLTTYSFVLYKNRQSMSEFGGVHLYMGYVYLISESGGSLKALNRAFDYLMRELDDWLRNILGIQITNINKVREGFYTNLVTRNDFLATIADALPFSIFKPLQIPANIEAANQLSISHLPNVIRAIESISAETQTQIYSLKNLASHYARLILSAAAVFIGSILPVLLNIFHVVL